jgi:uncharacterized membrane protein
MSSASDHPAKAPDATELRKFGFIFSAIFLALFELLLPWLKDRPLPLWPLYVAGPIATLALVWPMALALFYKGWMKFGLVAGAINTRILMSLIFFVMLTPIAWLMRALGKDLLALRLDRAAASYRVASVVRAKEQVEKPY